MGSFVPWLYYGFYCHYEHKLVYLSVVMVLGVLSIIVSLYDKFSEPNLRPLRAGKHNSKLIVVKLWKFKVFEFVFKRVCFQFSGVFASFGLSGIIPAIHYGLMEGWFNKISQASLGWLILMGKLEYHCNICLSFEKNYRFSRTPLHHWSCLLCIACSRTMVPWQIWFMGKKYRQLL